jgi:hypothetical protein
VGFQSVSIKPDGRQKSFEMIAQVESTLREFVLNVFADVPGKSMRVGRFMDKDAPLKLIQASRR